MATTQELETQVLEYINKKDSNVSFEQKEKDLDFEMSLTSVKTAFSKPIITMGIGAATSSLLAGALASAIPINLQFFAGFPTIVTGLLGRMVIGNKGGGTGRDFFNGVLIAGISQTVSRFIPATLPFGQAKQEFSQEQKTLFKQESTPCNDLKTMRPDVRW